MVYLSVAYPFFFALHTKGERRAMVLEIETDELDESLIYPDEDFISQAKATPTQSVQKIHNSIKDDLASYQQSWRASLIGLGNCCYMGSISPAAIKRVCFFEPNKRKYLAWIMKDPQVAIFNYREMSGKYLGLVAWMFGDAPRLPATGLEQVVVGPDSPGLADLAARATAEWLRESMDRTGIEVLPFAV